MRKRLYRTGCDAQLEMTPMIDVVFLLLVFFIVTMKPVDLLANLKVNRPAPADRPAPPSIALFRIDVGPRGYSVNKRMMSLPEIENIFVQTTALNSEEPIVIACGNRSLHSQLVKLLDLCAKHNLKNLSLCSTGVH